MEVLDQEFLIQDEEELDIFSKTVPIMLGDMNCNFDEYWWDVEFPKVTEFESEIFVVMEEKEDGFVFVEDKKELLQAPMQKEGQQQVDEDNVDEDEDDTASDNQKKSKKSNEANSKNLQSERNRRKRLNQQLFTLRSLVPNITKMDKRSILADALAYLGSLLQDIEKEIAKNSSLTSEPSSSIVPDDASLPVQLITPPYERCAAHPAITQMNAQMLQDATFVLEIGCNKAIGAVCQVQRSIEMLGVKITCSSVNGLNHESMITTAFVRVKKKSLVTPEKLLNQLELNARQLGLHLPTDSA